MLSGQELETTEALEVLKFWKLLGAAFLQQDLAPRMWLGLDRKHIEKAFHLEAAPCLLLFLGLQFRIHRVASVQPLLRLPECIVSGSQRGPETA